MIGLLKMPFSICQSGWKEIRNTSDNSLNPLGAQNNDLGAASQTLLTKVTLLLRRRLERAGRGRGGGGLVEADYLFHWHFQENEMMITKITHHTLHVDQRDRFTQHHFVKWTNKKRCEVENIK